MAITAPVQERAVDPYSSNRYSSIINRLSRIVTSGSDVILYPFQSFQLTRLSDTEISVGPGMCIKDDVLIHIKETFALDFEDNAHYIDDDYAMDSAGYYYMVLQYYYARSLPAPRAWIKIIRDTAGLYRADNKSDSYIFLGAAKIVDDGGYKLEDPDCLYYSDPDYPSVIRSTQSGNWTYVDGGTL